MAVIFQRWIKLSGSPRQAIYPIERRKWLVCVLKFYFCFFDGEPKKSKIMIGVSIGQIRLLMENRGMFSQDSARKAGMINEFIPVIHPNAVDEIGQMPAIGQ